jgi:hypothetical protein
MVRIIRVVIKSKKFSNAENGIAQAQPLGPRISSWHHQ